MNCSDQKREGKRTNLLFVPAVACRNFWRLDGGGGGYLSGGSGVGHSINGPFFFFLSKYLSFALAGLKLSILYMAPLSSAGKSELNPSIYSLDENYGKYASLCKDI